MKQRPSEEEPRHPIGVVAERTGLTPEVLRVWERRYGAVVPSRAEGGQRLYTNADVERLSLLRRATQGGRAIGSVVELPAAELERLVREDEEARLGRAGIERAGEVDLERAIDHVRELDAVGLESLLRRWALIMGLPRFLEEAVGPFLERVGTEWQAGRVTVAQEHSATAIVQRVVMSLLDAVPRAEKAWSVVIAAPAGERHEMGALLAAAVAAAEGWRVVYLGADLPAGEIVRAAEASGAHAVGLSVVYVEDRERTVRELTTVRELLPASLPLLVGGGGAAGLAAALEHPGTRVVEDLEVLRLSLRTWSGAGESRGRRG